VLPISALHICMTGQLIIKSIQQTHIYKLPDKSIKKSTLAEVKKILDYEPRIKVH
jgi:hypothetical protein